MKNILAILIALASSTSAIASAESDSTIVRNAYALSWNVDGIVAPLATGLFVYGQWTSSKLPLYNGNFNKSKLLPWDRPFAGTVNHTADLTSTALFVAAVAPVAIAALDWHDNQLGNNDVIAQVVMLSEVLGIESGLNQTARGFQLWPRPLVFGSKETPTQLTNDATSSFYSGHASGAFAAAVFTGEWFDKTHPNNANSIWVWSGALTLATGISVLRVVAGQHYPTDVVAGALMGSLVGYVVPKLHEHNEHSKQGTTFTLAPMPGGATLFVAF